MINKEFPPDCFVNTEYDWSGVTEPITLEQLNKWIAALRSGSYTQGKGSLKRRMESGKFCHCVLGVLAEEEGRLIELQTDISKDNWYGFLVGEYDEDQKNHIASEADLSVYPAGKNKTYYMPSNLQAKLFRRNDQNSTMDFPALADLLEELFGVKHD